jgi:hypothetical protein
MVEAGEIEKRGLQRSTHAGVVKFGMMFEIQAVRTNQLMKSTYVRAPLGAVVSGQWMK